MATHLDLQEQEQIDELKAFWKRYGNLLTWLVTLALLAYAAFNGWNWWQRDQSLKASAMFAELERVAGAGDKERINAVWGDLKSRYPSTIYAQQGALLSAQALGSKGDVEQAQAALEWLSKEGSEDEYKAVARLRLAGLLLEQNKSSEALAWLDKASGMGFDPLVQDRRGDAHLIMGNNDEARKAFEAAYKAMTPDVEYRRLIEAKLMSLGVDPKSLDAPATQKAKEKA